MDTLKVRHGYWENPANQNHGATERLGEKNTTMTMTQDLKIETWLVKRLIPYARNARTHSEAQVAQIAASIAEFGFNNPVLVEPSGGIIAGHAPVLAAQKLGLAKIPVIILAHLSENQKRAFILADNKLALNAGWDFEMLRLELEALVQQNFDLKLTGFDEKELAEALVQEMPKGTFDPEAVPELQSDPISRPGDLWTLGKHRILCGDGTRGEDLTRVLDGKPCHLVFTDPPYNVDYCGKGPSRMKFDNDNLGVGFEAFLRSACDAMLAVSAGAVYICMSSSELHLLHSVFSDAGGHWSTWIVWAKSTFTLGRSDYQRQYEPILYGWREGAKHYYCGDRTQSDVWLVDKPVRNDLHPTMKPIELVGRAIRNSSRPGNVVLDPFGGAGSTLISCENLARKACLIEIDPRYVDVGVRRWQDYTGSKAFLDGDGRTFEEIAADRTVSLKGGRAR
jgi:DNA modification methylase